MEILDLPNDRSSHSRPVPRGGGLAIVAICLVGWWGLLAFWPDCGWSGIASFGVGALLIAIVSWIDDVRSLPSALRFAVHSVAAILVILAYGYWRTVTLPLVGDVSLGWLGMPIVFLWIVGLTNAYNFMDGIDGIAATQAVVAGLGWVILGYQCEQWATTTLALLVTASSLGFLFHNWHPARIFMGDVGSAFLGFTFAFLALMAGQEDSRLSLAGVLLVWPFVLDSAFTFLRRLRKGEPVFAAHRSHLYQRLIVAGWSHTRTTVLYLGLDLVGLILALMFANRCEMADWLIVAGLPAVVCGLWLLVVQQERRYCATVNRPTSAA